jgi:hypothetical protein
MPPRLKSTVTMYFPGSVQVMSGKKFTCNFPSAGNIHLVKDAEFNTGVPAYGIFRDSRCTIEPHLCDHARAIDVIPHR